MKFLILVSIMIFSIIIPSSFAINITDAMSAINNAEEAIQEMVESDFSVSFVNDTLRDARNDFIKGNYESVIEKTKIIENKKEKTYEISDSLSSLEIRTEELEGMGLDTTDVRDILRMAEREFYYENYDEADKLIDEAFTKISGMEAKQTILKTRYEAAKNVIMSFVEKNRILIVTIFISLTLMIIISYKVVCRIKIKKELENLNLEKKSIEDLIEDTQKRRYKEDKMSKRSYNIAISKYKTRLREIEKRILTLQKKDWEKQFLKFIT